MFLTALGGGAFGNRPEWIRDAITAALAAYHSAPLDVFLVHYGSRVASEYASLSFQGEASAWLCAEHGDGEGFHHSLSG